MRVAASDPLAIAELVARYSSRVKRMLVRRLGDAFDVDDLVQETFLTVVRRALTIRDPSALPSFVLGVAIRQARNELRRRAARRWTGLSQAGEATAWDEDPTTRECLRHLRAALEQLDEASRLLFVLRHVDQLELTELASVQRVSLATLKRRLARAERRFTAIAARDPVLRDYLRSAGSMARVGSVVAASPRRGRTAAVQVCEAIG